MIIGNPVITGTNYQEYYNGDYTVIPATYAQTVPVRGKTMREDFTVAAVTEGATIADLIARNVEQVYTAVMNKK